MRRALPLLLLVLAPASACREAGGEGERSLERLERLAFVPSGECVLPRARRAGADCSNARPLLVDRFEVTRGEWIDWIARHPEALATRPDAFEARWEAGSESWPASWMTRDEARRFAHAEGVRLPSAREWMRVAAGTRAQRLPWGAPARSVSNSLELGLGRPAPVGTFENGRTTLGVYDLVGNVAEWVEGTLLEPDERLGDGSAWAMGGSYLNWIRDLFTPDASEPSGSRYNAERLDPAHRGEGLGFRVCAFADDFLREHLALWTDDPTTRQRLRDVGRGWGPAALPVLEALAAELGAAPAISALLEGARR